MEEVIICLQCKEETSNWKWLPCIYGSFKYAFCFECIINNLETTGNQLFVSRAQKNNFFTEVHQQK